MSVRLYPSLAACLLILTSPFQAQAEVYRWFDENGVVNYGDRPPQGARGVTALDLKPGIDSVIRGIPRDELERMRERDTQARLRALEAEVEELRAREAAQAAAPAAPANETVRAVYPVYGPGWIGPGRGGIGREKRPGPPYVRPQPLDPEQANRKLRPRPSRPAPAPDRGGPVRDQPIEVPRMR